MLNAESTLSKMPKDKLAAALRPHYDDLYSKLSEKQKKQIDFEQVVDGVHHRLRSVQHARPLRFDARPPVKAGSDDCLVAIGVVVADVLGLVFGLLGVSDSICRAVAKDVMEDLGADGARGLIALIQDIKNASSMLEKATAIWHLVVGIKNAVGLKAIFEALENEFSWYDWVISGVAIVAQLTAWFASDGLAAIAEIVLETTTIAYTVQDAEAVANCC